MLKQRLMTAAVTSLIWITCLSSCAGMKVKTWFLDGRDEKMLVRKNGGVITDRLSFFEADGYRCYSRADDEAIRAHMASLEACCSGGL